MKANLLTYVYSSAILILLSSYALHCFLIYQINWEHHIFTPIAFLVSLLVYYSYLFVYKVSGAIPANSQRDKGIKKVNLAFIFTTVAIYILAHLSTSRIFEWEKISVLVITIAIDIIIPDLIFNLFSKDNFPQGKNST